MRQQQRRDKKKGINYPPKNEYKYAPDTPYSILPKPFIPLYRLLYQPLRPYKGLYITRSLRLLLNINVTAEQRRSRHEVIDSIRHSQVYYQIDQVYYRSPFTFARFRVQ